MVRLGITAELDPRPGGVFRVDPNGRDVIRGKFLEVVAPSRLVFTWGGRIPDTVCRPGSTVVEITLRRRGSGTLVRLTHRDLPEAARETHESGWIHYLDRLKVVSEGGDPGPDPLADQRVQHG